MSNNLIFLDIDGVLNRHIAHTNGYCGTDPACVAAFNRIIRETDADIVVSSAWRYLVHDGMMTLGGFAAMLATHGVAVYRPDPKRPGKTEAGIVGVTRKDTMIPNPDPAGLPLPLPKERGRQIADYLENHLWLHDGPPPRYVVLDDGGRVGGDPSGEWCDMGIPAARHPVVWTKSEVGLTEEDADRAIAILKGQGQGRDGE